MNHSHLVEQLVQHLEPVKPVQLKRYVAIWFIFCAVLSFYYLSLLGLRPDLMIQLQNQSYIAALVFFGAAYLGTSWAAFGAAIPGQMEGRLRLSFTLFSTLTGVALLFYSGFGASSPGALTAGFAGFDLPSALGCCLRIALGTLPPNLIFIVILSRLSPTNRKYAVGFGAMSTAIMVSVVSQLNCPVSSIGHVIIGHGLLLTALSLVVWAVLHLVFKLITRDGWTS